MKLGILLGYKGALCVDYRLVQPGGHSAGEHPGPGTGNSHGV